MPNLASCYKFPFGLKIISMGCNCMRDVNEALENVAPVAPANKSEGKARVSAYLFEQDSLKVQTNENIA